jgi:hypothetical protein
VGIKGVAYGWGASGGVDSWQRWPCGIVIVLGQASPYRFSMFAEMLSAEEAEGMLMVPMVVTNNSSHHGSWPGDGV